MAAEPQWKCKTEQRRAKLAMGVQNVVALAILAVLLARAVNIAR